MLAGDVANGFSKGWRRILPLVFERIDPGRVHVFPGNHDFYRGHLDAPGKLAAVCVELGCHYAQQSEIRPAPGHRILMCTLWTDFDIGPLPVDVAMHAAEDKMNDYRHIRLSKNGYRRITGPDICTAHKLDRAWLEERLAEPFQGETTVITHHAPHPRALRHPEADVAAAYASDFSDMVLAYRPARWLYGHTHHPVDFRIGGCQIQNVSVGYPAQEDLLRSPAAPKYVFDLPDVVADNV
nr:metallophosphoesterase [Roseivivax isoporae]